MIQNISILILQISYHQKEDYKNALKYWEKTVEYNPNNIDAKVNLANTYAILGIKRLQLEKYVLLGFWIKRTRGLFLYTGFCF